MCGARWVLQSTAKCLGAPRCCSLLSAEGYSVPNGCCRLVGACCSVLPAASAACISKVAVVQRRSTIVLLESVLARWMPHCPDLLALL